MEVPLVDKDYLLERTPGNGGWTYAPTVSYTHLRAHET